jgi:DNA invertase Pin-like site-specific DNA recombinase
MIVPSAQAMLDFAHPGDTIVVWRLDRLGRSLTHLIEMVMGLQARGINFRSLTEYVDTSTPGGKFTFHLFGV